MNISDDRPKFLLLPSLGCTSNESIVSTFEIEKKRPGNSFFMVKPTSTQWKRKEKFY